MKTTSSPLDDKRRLRKGTDLLIIISDVHRNPKFHPDPLEYNPERFSVENIGKMHPYSYLPFSMGPRNCLGILVMENR
jgi:cytochrome P450